MYLQNALQSKWQHESHKNGVASLYDAVVQAKIKQLHVLMSNQNKVCMSALTVVLMLL